MPGFSPIRAHAGFYLVYVLEKPSPHELVSCRQYPHVKLVRRFKLLANEDTLLRTHCCRHKCFPVCPARNICCGHKFCVRDTKNVSDFVQKQFVSAANVSQFARARKHHEQQCVRNNVSSFASTFKLSGQTDSQIYWQV